MRVRQALFHEAPRIPVSPLAVLEERHSNQMMIKKETHEREVEQVLKKARIFSRLVAQSSGGCDDLDDHDEKNMRTHRQAHLPEHLDHPWLQLPPIKSQILSGMSTVEMKKGSDMVMGWLLKSEGL